MKFTINGREYEDYQLSNEQIVSLVDGGTLMRDEKAFLMEKVYQRFKHECCARKGEGKDELFARNFSDYVNRCPNDFKKAARAMGRDHRYLQSEMFKVVLAYIKELSNSYVYGYYDDRNEWACEKANEIALMLVL
jgi:hypothetical protein